MTIKEAILQVLEDNKGSYTYKSVLELINKKNYIDWSNAQTPADTVSALLGRLINNNDTRIKRVKGKRGYEYYWSAYESELNLPEVIAQKKTSIRFKERDLHKLLSSYLKSLNIHTKTITHQKSTSKDDHQKWIHPDMVGIEFLDLKNPKSNALLKLVHPDNAFDLISFEIKREIKTDYELKKCFFQAVSNSSWANQGFLVAFDISHNLMDEMERLNESFGIGVIELNSNPYESKVLFLGENKDLDFTTIDKLCEVNDEFKKFIEHTEAIFSAPDKYRKSTRQVFERFCDDYFKTDSEIEEYCKEKNIPYQE